MKIDSINRGIVIDHIKAGNAMKIYEYLGLDKVESSVAIIKNVKSSKMGKKDIIKIDEVTEVDIAVLGYIDPEITVNIINDWKITEKRRLELPSEIVGVVKCKNPRCITSTESALPQRFKLCDRDKRVYRCVYCDAEIK
jgi:aspartate carbamoyltransferase regulatory subunit